MKKLITVIFAVLISMSTFAKHIPESKVPVLVKNAFYLTYPEVKNVTWEVTDVEDYKASYQAGDDYGSAFYSKNGEFIESDITVSWRQVPFEGRMSIYHLNKKGHISNALKITTPKETFYQIDVKNKHKHYEILLDQEGNILG